ncbi:MAG: hypothetical protein LUG57_10920 [Oscillospiraceae bacterium]|nr:hypothetical protein [Oscillospiraceae bacterium]
MKESKITLRVLNPRGVIANPKAEGLKAPRVRDLNGKRVALLAEKPDSMLFMNAMERLLKARHPDVEIVNMPSYASPVVGNNTAEVAAKCDAWLQGVKTSTSSRFDGDVAMEKLGKPGVCYSVDVLMEQKHIVSTINGISTVRTISIPSLDYFLAKADQKLMDKVAEDLFDETVQALTSPLTEEEMNPPQPVYNYEDLCFSADTYEEALEQFQQYCMKYDMGDGLPLIPPTRESVDAMLQGTSYPADKEIGIVLPGGGIATVEKIAINAVMAGARPEYLPLIIAMIDCITDKNFNQYHINTGILPVYWVSGPLVEELGMNNEVNYLGPGNRVNNTIARAVALCQINIGWRILSVYASPGGAGRPDNFTNFLIPENLKHGPWEESYGVSAGYSADETVVGCCEHMYCMNGPGECLFFGSFEDSMNVIKDMFKVDAFHVGTGHSSADELRYMLILHPTFAHDLVKHGYTKESFLQWIYDATTIDWDKMNDRARERLLQEVRMGLWMGLREEDCKSGLKLEPFCDTSQVMLMVSGGCCGGTSMYKTTAGSTAKIADCPPDFEPRPFMNKVVHGATLTKAGR